MNWNEKVYYIKKNPNEDIRNCVIEGLLGKKLFYTPQLFSYPKNFINISSLFLLILIYIFICYHSSKSFEINYYVSLLCEPDNLN